MERTAPLSPTRSSIFFTKGTQSPWPLRFIQISLGLVFLYAGLTKLWDPKAFARIISQYDLIPESFLPVAAIGLPILELLAGIGVILAIRGSLSLMFSLLGFFTIVLWYGILAGLDVDCGCFSSTELEGQAGLWQAFYRDLAMMGGIFLIYGFRWWQLMKNNPRPF